MRSEEIRAQTAQFLSFFIRDEEYAVDILRVKEIIEYATVTKMPSMPRAIRGVVNLRGRVVPVVDLGPRFGLSETTVTKWTCIVMLEVQLEGESSVVGVMVDSVSQVVEFLPDDIEPPPAFGTQVRVDFIRGMGKSGKKFVLILDIDRLISPEELLIDGAAAEKASDAPGEQATPEGSATPPASTSGEEGGAP